MVRSLLSRLNLGKLRRLEDVPVALAEAAQEAVSDMLAAPPAEATAAESARESRLLETAGWVSAAVGALALGLFVGRELRQRYKFNRRTPYDFYAHSGDEMQDMEFGVGI